MVNGCLNLFKNIAWMRNFCFQRIVGKNQEAGPEGAIVTGVNDEQSF